MHIGFYFHQLRLLLRADEVGQSNSDENANNDDDHQQLEEREALGSVFFDHNADVVPCTRLPERRHAVKN